MLRRALAVAGLALLVLLVGPSPAAQAHAFLTASNPGDGQVLDDAPAQLRLDFSESVVVAATSIDLVDGAGQHHAVHDLSVVASDSDDTEEPVQLLATLPRLPHGTYRVVWQTLSSDDLHRTSGVLAFGIGERVGAIGSVDEAPSPPESVVRWLMWAGLAGVLGPLVVARLGGGTVVGARRRRALRLARWSAALLTLATVVLPAVQLRSMAGAWRAAAEPGIGLAWGVRAAGALVTLLLVTGVVRGLCERVGLRGRRGWRPVLLGAAVLAVVTASAVRGHLGSAGAPLLVVADVVHVLASAAWAGGVLALATVQLGAAGPRAVVPAKAFAAAAAAGLVLAVATGLVLAGHGVSTTAALVRADYGRALLVKSALVVVVLALAVVNHRKGRGSRRLGITGRRWIAAEAAVLLAVVGAAAVVASTAPASSPRWQPEAPASRLASVRADDLQLEVSVGPNQVGPAFVTVAVLQTRRPAPAPVRSLRVSLTRAGEPALGGEATVQPDGSWAYPLSLPEAGRWHVEVTARRPALPDATARTSWVVGGGVHGPAGWRLAVPARTAALTLVVGWLLVLLVLLRRRRAGARPVRLPVPDALAASTGTPLVVGAPAPPPAGTTSGTAGLHPPSAPPPGVGDGCGTP